MNIFLPKASSDNFLLLKLSVLVSLILAGNGRFSQGVGAGAFLK
jgi:hypothetical protein